MKRIHNSVFFLGFGVLTPPPLLSGSTTKTFFLCVISYLPEQEIHRRLLGNNVFKIVKLLKRVDVALAAVQNGSALKFAERVLWSNYYCCVEGVEGALSLLEGVLDNRDVAHEDGGVGVDGQCFLVVELGQLESFLQFLFVMSVLFLM